MLEMHSFLPILGAYAALIVGVSTTPLKEVRDLGNASRNQQTSGPSDNLVIDLGYEKYQGVSNATTGLNNWFGFVIGLPNLNVIAG